MRMKKIMILAVTALALAACAKTYEVKEVAPPANPIGFGTWTDVLTKARATGNDNTAFANGEAFNVYGNKTLSGTPTPVFNGDPVTATVSGSTVTWDYTNKRYWDPAASQYTFYAILPSGLLGEATAGQPYATTGKFNSIATVSLDDPTAFASDILVATEKVVPGTGSAAPYSYSNPVQIEFNHIATCVDMYVKKDYTLNNATVTVTDLSLVNINKQGSFAVSGYDATSHKPTYAWTPASPAVNLGTSNVYQILTGANKVVGSTTTYTDHNAGTTDPDPVTVDLFKGLVFMPQVLANNTQRLRISYTIQVGTETANTYTDVEFDLNTFKTTDTDNNSGSGIAEWVKGTHYTYYLTIGANAITFTAQVADWATATGYHYLVN